MSCIDTVGMLVVEYRSLGSIPSIPKLLKYSTILRLTMTYSAYKGIESCGSASFIVVNRCLYYYSQCWKTSSEAESHNKSADDYHD
jgi:hypothetical protein